MSKKGTLYNTRTDWWWDVLYPWSTTMIQTQTEKEREDKIREVIEELTTQIVKEDTAIEYIQKRIDKLPASRFKDLKGLVNERVEHENKRKFLDSQRNEKINLLNQIS